MKCNCENRACGHDLGCQRPAGATKIMYIGFVCDACAQKYPDEYKLVSARPPLESDKPLRTLDDLPCHLEREA